MKVSAQGRIVWQLQRIAWEDPDPRRRRKAEHALNALYAGAGHYSGEVVRNHRGGYFSHTDIEYEG